MSKLDIDATTVITPLQLKDIKFSIFDYTIFCGLLLVSLLIGIFYGFISKKKQNSTVEYLMGSKQMSVFPVSVSLVATHISAVTVLGVPAEVYRNGTQYWATLISGIIITLAVAHLYLPVFYNLQHITIFTYLDKRFDVRCRKLVSGLWTLAAIIYLPIMIYAPAIAFNQVTGVNLHVITPIMCGICIFYTTFGGLRAVVWTDTIQFVSMICGIGIIMTLGTLEVGGLSNLYDINDEGGRIVWFNMDPSTTVRSSFFSVTIGLTTLWLSSLSLSPEGMQRFLSVPSLNDSKKVVYLFGVGHCIMKMFAVFCGVIIYGKYAECDPVTLGVVKKPDQIFPYYAMDIARNIPGIAGLFVAGVFSAALSSLSSSLNSISGAIYGDFFKPMYPNTTEKTASNIMKVIVFLIGCLATALVMVVEKLGNIFSLAISLTGVTAGPVLGIFTMGMVLPRSNKHGAFWGTLVSISAITFLTIGSQLAVARKDLIYPTLPFRTDGCDKMGYPTWLNSSDFIGNPNSTIHIHNEHADHSNVHPIFRLGLMYYAFLGTIIVFIIGYPISLSTGGNDNIDVRYLAPFVRIFYEKNLKKQKEKEAEMKPLNQIIDAKLEALYNDDSQADNTK